MDEQEGRLAPAVDLYWIPLVAGGHVVRLSGTFYEALKALVEHRPRLDLYHSALQIMLPDDRFVIECAAILNLRVAAAHTAVLPSALALRRIVDRLRRGLVPDPGDARIVFQLFDLLHLDGEDLRPLPLLQRKQRLQALLKRAHEPRLPVDAGLGENRA